MQKQFYIHCFWLLSISFYTTTSMNNAIASTENGLQLRTIETIQKHNNELLQETLSQGWKSFCETPVDEAVMLLHSGINPCDAIVHVMTLNNQTIELPIKAISEIMDFDINPKRKTLIYVNAYYTSESYFSVQAHLKMLQVKRRDLNIIIVDFARDILQLYYTVRHYVVIQGHFIAKILEILKQAGIAPIDITLVGHSVGANIAALAAKIFANKQQQQQLMLGGTPRTGQLIAIDPAVMCNPSSDIYVHANVSERVVVIHGEGDVFGVRKQLGTIDIYPNGIGYFSRRKLQPGCDTNICSHMYSFVLFMEALIEGVMIPAVKCKSWSHFRKHQCDYNDIIAIGVKYPEKANGLYFCLTQPNPPYTLMEHGLKYQRGMKTYTNTNNLV